MSRLLADDYYLTGLLLLGWAAAEDGEPAGHACVRVRGMARLGRVG